MLYSNDQFGSKKDCITDSLYVQMNFDENILPPPPNKFLLDNTGEELKDNDSTPLESPT